MLLMDKFCAWRLRQDASCTSTDRESAQHMWLLPTYTQFVAGQSHLAGIAFY
jgi:hypothetical protein